MNLKSEIIRKALVLIGAAASGAGGISNSGNKTSKAEGLAAEFVDSAIEETMLAVRWGFALKQLRNIDTSVNNTRVIDGSNNKEFSQVADITDCLKVAVIVPSNLEWYVEQGRIYFLGKKVETIFYYSAELLEQLLSNDQQLMRIVPTGFVSLASLSLAVQIAFALYSDSVFADGLRRQYLLKLEEMRQTYAIDYNLVNSGVV